MTRPVRQRLRPNSVAACIQARRYAAAVALFVAAGCAQEPPALDDASTGCASLDFFFRERAFNLDSSSHMDLRSTPIQVVVKRQARPLSEPIPYPAALAATGGASPPGADAPAAKPPEPQHGDATGGRPWIFALMDRLDCAWPVDFDPDVVAALKVRLHVRIGQDGHVESNELILEHGDPAHLLAAFRATALAAIQRTFPLPGPSELLDHIAYRGLDVTFELRGFERNLRAAVTPR